MYKSKWNFLSVLTFSNKVSTELCTGKSENYSSTVVWLASEDDSTLVRDTGGESGGGGDNVSP